MSARVNKGVAATLASVLLVAAMGLPGCGKQEEQAATDDTAAVEQTDEATHIVGTTNGAAIDCNMGISVIISCHSATRCQHTAVVDSGGSCCLVTDGTDVTIGRDIVYGDIVEHDVEHFPTVNHIEKCMGGTADCW